MNIDVNGYGGEDINDAYADTLGLLLALLYQHNLAGGFAGWICKTAGNPSTWKTFGAIGA